MALTTGFQSGSYTGTWNSSALGLIADAWRIRQTMEAQGVRADYYGDSVIDLIYRGGNAFCIFEGLAWSSVAAIVGGSTSIGVMGVANLGCFFSNAAIAKALVLTARISSGNCAPSPATVTATLAGLAEGFDIEYSLGNSMRTLPVMLRLLPYAVSSEVNWYVMT